MSSEGRANSFGKSLQYMDSTDTCKFLAEKGMCVGGGQRGLTGTEQIAVLNADADARLPTGYLQG